MDVKEVESKLQGFDPDEGSERWEYWSDGGKAWFYWADPPEQYWSSWSQEYRNVPTNRKEVPIPELGVVSLAEDFGGEGQGEQYYIVLRIDMEEGVRYFKVDGWYSSYVGGELDGPLFEVKPVAKTITVYERI